MTLSLIVVMLIPMFLIPAILLPRNKLHIYTWSLLIASVPVILFFIIENTVPELGLEDGIGEFFEWMFSWLVRDESLLTRAEALHIYAYYGYLIIFVLVYLISYLILKATYIGTNPSVHKASRTIGHILLSTIFFVLTYVLIAMFLIEIRQSFGIEDGFLSWLFEAIYPIGA